MAAIKRLLSKLRERAYRSAWVEAQIETLIPLQIRTMRARRGWTQKQLAAHAGMAQGRISVLENPAHEGSVNVKTLVELAKAFDVALVVRFAPFSETSQWADSVSADSHDVPDFATEWAAVTASEAVSTQPEQYKAPAMSVTVGAPVTFSCDPSENAVGGRITGAGGKQYALAA